MQLVDTISEIVNQTGKRNRASLCGMSFHFFFCTIHPNIFDRSVRWKSPLDKDADSNRQMIKSFQRCTPFEVLNALLKKKNTAIVNAKCIEYFLFLYYLLISFFLFKC